jgi:hypothetical protein
MRPVIGAATRAGVGLGVAVGSGVGRGVAVGDAVGVAVGSVVGLVVAEREGVGEITATTGALPVGDAPAAITPAPTPAAAASPSARNRIGGLARARGVAI